MFETSTVAEEVRMHILVRKVTYIINIETIIVINIITMIIIIIFGSNQMY